MNVKRISLVVFLLFVMITGFAQKEHFIYLQTDNNQPFYVKMNQKVLSSSAAGYLILPKLQPGDIELTVGFPKKEFPEETFVLPVKESNEGYLLKLLDEKGWSLFNLQSMALIMPLNVSKPVLVQLEPKKQNAFSEMLATVTKDSTLLKKTVPVSTATPEVVSAAKPEQTVSAVSKDPVSGSASPDSNVTVSTVQETANNAVVKTQDAGKPEKDSSSVSRLLYTEGRDGSEMIYVDKAGRGNDTVRVLIPAAKGAETAQPKSVITVYEPTPKKDIPVIEYTITPTKESPVESKPDSADGRLEKAVERPASTIEIRNADSAEKKSQIIIAGENIGEKKNADGQLIVLPPVVSSSSINSDCRDFATDSDFLKIRKKMAAERNAEDMVNAARKFFKLKCYSTEQIRNLSFLFLNDEGRYMFFDAAYPYVSDSDKFATLQSQLSDEYYMNRFKAMIHK